jgi:hypothetical protein
MGHLLGKIFGSLRSLLLRTCGVAAAAYPEVTHGPGHTVRCRPPGRHTVTRPNAARPGGRRPGPGRCHFRFRRCAEARCSSVGSGASSAGAVVLLRSAGVAPMADRHSAPKGARASGRAAVPRPISRRLPPWTPGSPWGPAPRRSRRSKVLLTGRGRTSPWERAGRRWGMCVGIVGGPSRRLWRVPTAPRRSPGPARG